MDNRIEELRSQLSSALKDSVLDINVIIDLTNKMAQADPDLVRFSTDAGIISRLGRELVAKQETAVAELIKNAYDADAVNVDLIFENALLPGGQLTIQDDGTGMNREQLVNGFMRLSSADKINNPVSNLFERKRAGRKGIGRFAVQRLGTSLTITTQTQESNNRLVVDIDWDAFVSGRDLISVSSRIQELPKQRSHGTTLFIQGLLEGWTDAEIRRSYRYILELLQPFSLSAITGGTVAANTQKNVIDPGFRVSISRHDDGKIITIADEQLSVYKYAIADIEAYLDQEGKALCTIRSERFSIDESIRILSKQLFSDLPKFKLKAYYFIWQPDFYPRTLFNRLKAMSQESSGVRVYRNGFRVRPYGERTDDWLGLDASTANRDILPPHANINFFGFLEITDENGAFVDETSSREGLIENEAFRTLQKICSNALKDSARKIAELRGRKQTKAQRDWEEIKGNANDVIRKAAERLKFEAKSQFEYYQDDTNTKGQLESKGPKNPTYQPLFGSFYESANSIAEEILQAEAVIRESHEMSLQELGLLRVLASMGLTIGEFTHEVRQTLVASVLDAESLSKKLEPSHPLRRRAVRLASNINRFSSYASYFDKTIQDNIRRQLEPQDFRIAINSFAGIIADRLNNLHIRWNANFSDDELISCPMHISEITSILFNLYSNSQKAIARAHTVGEVRVDVFSEGTKLIMEFSDNGDGISQEAKPHVFEAFYTTATNTDSSLELSADTQGSGLGLKIVKDIVEGYLGTVSVVEAPPGFSTTIRVELPVNISK